MEKTVSYRNTIKFGLIITLCLGLSIAFCTSATGNSIDDITNSKIKSYTNNALHLGAPALNTSSRLIYRDAIETIKGGNWKEGKKKLLLARDLSSDYSAPSYTLARIELMHAHPDFIIYFLEGLNKDTMSFYKRNLLLINIEITLIIALGITLFVYLVLLLIKYSSKFNHKPMEIYSKKIAFPPPKYLGLMIITGLLFMRLGLAIYALLLIIIVWSYISRKEKTVLLILVILLSFSSFFIGKRNNLVPGIDEYSITRRLSLINEKGADKKTIQLIKEIDSPEFRAERNFALGTLMYKRDELETAKEYLRRSVSEKNDLESAYINLGNIYFKEGYFDKALAGYRNASSIDSTNAVAQYNIGQTCIKKMRFRLSSSALTKAGEFGIERYKKENPAITFGNNEILDSGFRKSDLRRIAAREAKNRKLVLIDEIIGDWIFLPFSYMWFLLPISILIGGIIKRLLPKEWNVFNCDNCDNPVCPNCVDSEHGINLCKDCSEIIKGLSSVKVTEALLRRRRQKITKKTTSSEWKKMLFFPGGTHIYTKKTFSGVLIIFISSIAILSLVWNGFYFKDPRYEFTSFSLWKMILYLTILVIEVVISTRVSNPRKNKSYNILPQETHIEQSGEKSWYKTENHKSPGVKNIEAGKDENFSGVFMDTL
ncbi:tetratricopeptide repeat protein [bacterium]|nr:tetratricopeptide repeat protein [bacterium]